MEEVSRFDEAALNAKRENRMYERRLRAMVTWEDLIDAGIPAAVRADGKKPEFEFTVEIRAIGVDVEKVQKIAALRDGHVRTGYTGVSIAWKEEEE